MNTYFYRVGNESGQILAETVQADSIAILRQQLENKGFFIIELRKAAKYGEFLNQINPFKLRISQNNLMLFCKEFSILLKAGLPVVNCLEILNEHTVNKKLGEMLKNVKNKVEGGLSLSDALSAYPRVFNPFFTASIKSGETTDTLVEVFNHLYEYIYSSTVIKRKVISALIYPLFLMILAFLAVIYLLVHLIPTFSKFYSQLGTGGLPFSTQIIVSISEIVRGNLLFIIIFIIALIASIRYWKNTPKGKELIDRTMLTIPLINEFVTKYIFANIARVMAALLKSGVPLPKTLHIATNTIVNVIISRKMKEVEQLVNGGTALSAAMRFSNVASPMTCQMIHIGEQTGSLEEILKSVAELYEEEVKSTTTALLVAIEPLLMLIIGIIIGGILISMYLPIFSMRTAI